MCINDRKLSLDEQIRIARERAAQQGPNPPPPKPDDDDGPEPNLSGPGPSRKDEPER